MTVVPDVPEEGQALARTSGALPASRTQETHPVGREGWHETLDQLEIDVSRAEQLTVGTRLIGDRGTAAPAGAEGPAEDSLSDHLLASLSVSLPDEPPWEPAPGHPPIPVEYAERARTLLDRQIAIAAHITREIAMGRQQAAYATHVDGLEEVAAAPAFIDEAI